jgi:hypothetical protein
MASSALVSQVGLESAILQQPNGLVSQVVVETAILQQPFALVSQVVCESAILPSTNVAVLASAAASVGGMGCVPHCVDPCGVDKVDRPGGGDLLLLALIIAAGIVIGEA